MTREQMQKEVARLNHKIEIELTEIKNLANWLLAKADDADSITFHCPSRMIAQSKSTLKELIAKPTRLKKSVTTSRLASRFKFSQYPRKALKAFIASLR